MPLDDLILPPHLSEKLEDLEFQYGAARGKLALAMDLASDAEIAAGQLRLYCRNSMDPRRGHPDLEELIASLQVVRSLVKGAFRAGEK